MTSYTRLETCISWYVDRRVPAKADEKQYHDVFVTVDKRGEGLREGEKAITHKQAHRAVSLPSAKEY